MNKVHVPVLVGEVLSFINEDIQVFLDLTIGAAGHSVAVFEKCKDVFIVGMDRDSEILKIAEENLLSVGARFRLINDTFSNVDKYIDKCDVALLDLGVSSFQIDSEDRGFSYRYDAPLDMKMGKDSEDFRTFINHANTEQLEYILKEYGDFNRVKGLSKRIVNYRREKGIKTTYDLNEALTGKRESKGNESFLSRVYQSFRIYLNNELDELQICLSKIPDVLECGGLLMVISYHSGEDRIVKRFIKENEDMERINKKVIKPSADEIKNNPRSRSAKLRVARRVC